MSLKTYNSPFILGKTLTLNKMVLIIFTTMLFCMHKITQYSIQTTDLNIYYSLISCCVKIVKLISKNNQQYFTAGKYINVL